MNLIGRLTVFLILTFSGINLVSADMADPHQLSEFGFVKEFSGKSAEYVREALGEPEQVSVRENASGRVEFLVYKDLVKVGNSSNRYKYTQIGIINGYVETIGNTNRAP